MSDHSHAPYTARRELQQSLPPVRRQLNANSSTLPRSTNDTYSQYSANAQYWNPSSASTSNNVYSQTQSQSQSQSQRDNTAASNSGHASSWQNSQPQSLRQGQSQNHTLHAQAPAASRYGRQDASSINAVESLTASFQAQVALPSTDQVQTYLVQHMKKPAGLYSGWQIEGRPFDIYELFSSVLRAGGSSEVTRRDLWPVVAALVHLPVEPGTNDMRSSPAVGMILRKFFLELLGGLEILWDQTRGIDNSGGAGTGAGSGNRPDSGSGSAGALQHLQQQVRQVDSQPHSRAASHFGNGGGNGNASGSRSGARYDDRATSQPYAQPRQQSQQQQVESTSASSQNFNRANDYYGPSFSTTAQQTYSTAPNAGRYASNNVAEPQQQQQQQQQQASGSRQRAPVAHHATAATQNQSQAQSQRTHMGTMAPSDMHLRQMSNNSQAGGAAPSNLAVAPAPTSAALAPPVSVSAAAEAKAAAPKKKGKKGKKDAAAQHAPVEEPPPPAPPPPPPVPAPAAVRQEVDGMTAPPKKKRRNRQEMAEFRAAEALAKEARKAEKEGGYSDRPGQADLAAGPSGSSAVRDEAASAPAPALASAPAPPAVLVPATQDTEPTTAAGADDTQPAPKKKRKRRSKAQIEADKAAATAAAAPPIEYHHDGVAKVGSFDLLVKSNVLPLPPTEPDVVAETPEMGASRYYAARCQELRTAVRRNREKAGYRELSDDEVHFWNALVSILKHNPEIVIPGADYFKNQAAEAEAAAAAAIASGSQPANTSVNGEATRVKKVGGRPRLPRDENGNIIHDPALLPRKEPKRPKEPRAPRDPDDPSASRPLKRKPEPERDESGKVVKRVRGRLRGDGLAKYINEDGEVSWRLPPPVTTTTKDADGTVQTIVVKPLPTPTHHGITAQPFEARSQVQYRSMESMMSVFGANPARRYLREEDQSGQAITRKTPAYPGSVDKRILHISKVVRVAGLRRDQKGPMRILGMKEPTPVPEPVPAEEIPVGVDLGDEDADGEDEGVDQSGEGGLRQEVQATPAPKPRFVLDAIEFGFMPPATIRKYKNPDQLEPEPGHLPASQTTQINGLDVAVPAMVDDQFDDEDEYEALPEWEEEEGMNYENMDVDTVGELQREHTQTVETPTRRGTRSNPAPPPAQLAPTPASVRLNKQLRAQLRNGKKGPRGKVLGSGPQQQRSRLSIVSYPERDVTPAPPAEPRRTRSGLLVETPVPVRTPAAGSSRRPMAGSSRVTQRAQASQAQSEPRRMRSGLLVHDVPSPSPPRFSATASRKGRGAASTPTASQGVREQQQAQTTPRRTRSGMVVVPSPTPPPMFTLADLEDSPEPTSTRGRSGRNGAVVPLPDRTGRRTRNGAGLANGQAGPAVNGRLQNQGKGRTRAVREAVQPRTTRSRRSVDVEAQIRPSDKQLRQQQRQQQQQSRNREMVQRKLHKPKPVSRPVVGIANAARRLRSMRYNMSLRNGGRGKGGDSAGAVAGSSSSAAAASKQAGRHGVAAHGKPAKVTGTKAASQVQARDRNAPGAKQKQNQAPRRQVVDISVDSDVEMEEEYESEEEAVRGPGRGMPIIELPTRKKAHAAGGRKSQSTGVDMALVVLPIRPRKRFELYQAGVYDPSEDEESEYSSASESDNDIQLISMPYTAKRHANVRPRSPEPIPIRFAARGVREDNPLLKVQSLLARTVEHPCGWKHCGATLASEEMLRRHVYKREHSFEGRMQGPHVARHHEGEEPRPLANLTQIITPPFPPADDLPSDLPIERLAAPPVAPSAFGIESRDKWVRERVQKDCFAPEDPCMQPRNPLHILTRIEGERDVLDDPEGSRAEEGGDDVASEEGESEAESDVMVPRSYPGRKTAVVVIPTKKRRLTKLRSGQARAPTPVTAAEVERSMSMSPVGQDDDEIDGDGDAGAGADADADAEGDEDALVADDVNVDEDDQAGSLDDDNEAELDWEDVDDSQVEGDDADSREETFINEGTLDASHGADLEEEYYEDDLEDDEQGQAEVDDAEDHDEDAEEDEGEEVGDETAQWGDETLALVPYSDSEEDGEENDEEGEDDSQLEQDDDLENGEEGEAYAQEGDGMHPDDPVFADETGEFDAVLAEEDDLEVESDSVELDDFAEDEVADDDEQGFDELGEEETYEDGEADEDVDPEDADDADDDDDSDTDAEDSEDDEDDPVDRVDNQVRFEFDTDQAALPEGGERDEAYDQVGTPFDLGLVSPSRQDADQDGQEEQAEDAVGSAGIALQHPDVPVAVDQSGEAGAEEMDLEDEQGEMDLELIRAVQEASAAAIDELDDDSTADAQIEQHSAPLAPSLSPAIAADANTLVDSGDARIDAIAMPVLAGAVDAVEDIAIVLPTSLLDDTAQSGATAAAENSSTELLVSAAVADARHL